MPFYNKLVRDKIPVIIENSGKSYQTKILDQTEYIKELKIKLGEEVEEYLEAANDSQALEELADIMEIIHTLTTVHGSSIEEVEAIRTKKAEERGGFQDKVFLIDVEDE
ncbi:phosphoribosyl-ATP pyrophosphohydrolase [Anaerobacillus sp. MEB173]|uniref:nucleoside triphosphate pyrophosphohydrolase n=1 Tax=Anaerobacillus sp. MEB173 TaxID=3383345 RepID=UPI003F93C6ED